jgi:DNA-binding transcriptional regulator LsrR (DeoR family)
MPNGSPGASTDCSAASLDERIVRITAEQLRRHGRVVALAGGRMTVQAIRAALWAGIVRVLGTDRVTARALHACPA